MVIFGREVPTEKAFLGGRYVQIIQGNSFFLFPKYKYKQGHYGRSLRQRVPHVDIIMVIADSASAEYCSTFQCPSCVVVCHRRDISVFHLYNMFYTIQTIYFLKALGPRISKRILPSVLYTNTQIHKYKNTQIQHMTKCQKYPTCGNFLKIGLFKDIKNDIPMCQTRNYWC